MKAAWRSEALALSVAVVLTAAIFGLRVLEVLRDPEPIGMDAESLNAANFLALGDSRWDRFSSASFTGEAVTVMALLVLFGLRLRRPVRSRAVWCAAVFVGIVLVVQVISDVTAGEWMMGVHYGGEKPLFVIAYGALLVALWRGFDSSSVARRRWRRRSRPGRRIGIGILREDE